MFTACSQPVHNLFTTCSRHVHDMFTICSRHVHDMFMTFLCHVRHIFTRKSWTQQLLTKDWMITLRTCYTSTGHWSSLFFCMSPPDEVQEEQAEALRILLSVHKKLYLVLHPHQQTGQSNWMYTIQCTPLVCAIVIVFSRIPFIKPKTDILSWFHFMRSL